MSSQVTIQVSKTQLAHIEYLLEQSLRGNHLLFEPQDVRRAMSKRGRSGGAVLTEEQASAVEPIISQLLQEPTLQRKRALLESLDQRTYDTVIRTYFCIVENNLYEKTETPH